MGRVAMEYFIKYLHLVYQAGPSNIGVDFYGEHSNDDSTCNSHVTHCTRNIRVDYNKVEVMVCVNNG